MSKMGKLSNQLGLFLAIWVKIAGATSPAISLIIDDLGYLRAAGLRVVALPGAVTCSILPHTPYAVMLARAAQLAGKEVMLHIPMEARDNAALGPGALRQAMSRAEFTRVLRSDLALIPNLVGVNNHMGSWLTQQPVAMSWLMEELKRHPGIFFLDSRTTAATVAQDTAQAMGVATTRRDLFLDNRQDGAAIRVQLMKLIDLARVQGTAVAIGHPHPTTLQVLEEFLPRLSGLGVRLRPISETVARRVAEPSLRLVLESAPMLSRLSSMTPSFAYRSSSRFTGRPTSGSDITTSSWFVSPSGFFRPDSQINLTIPRITNEPSARSQR